MLVQEEQAFAYKDQTLATSVSGLSPPPLPTLTRSLPSHSVGGASTVGGATMAVSSSDEEMRRRLEGLDVDAVKGVAPDNQNPKPSQPRSSSKKSMPQSVSTNYVCVYSPRRKSAPPPYTCYI